MEGASAPEMTNRTFVAKPERDSKYLTFSLAGEEYGIGILKVKEIIGMMAVTPVPQASKYVRGVINLRGKVIPVIDLRLKFEMRSVDDTEQTCIIIVETESDERKVPVGIVVDSVSEVLNMRAGEIEAPPAFGAGPNTAYILGMAKSGDKVKILIDIDRVLSAADGDTEPADLAA